MSVWTLMKSMGMLNKQYLESRVTGGIPKIKLRYESRQYKFILRENHSY